MIGMRSGEGWELECRDWNFGFESHGLGLFGVEVQPHRISGRKGSQLRRRNARTDKKMAARCCF